MPIPLETLLADAPYLADLAARHADWLVGARDDPDRAFAGVIAEIRAAEGLDEAALATLLRMGKGRVALLAAVAETGGQWTTGQATAALSDLADAALDAALAALMRRAAERGELLADVTPDAAGCGLALFALGKHGGRELNYSSDIDIVAFFDPQKPILADPLEATKFYTRIVRGLVALMQDRTADGYVFRTDLRLRPDPGSTPVAIPSIPRSPITRAAARTGSVPPGSRRGPAPATRRWARPFSRNWRPMSGASISTSPPSPISRR